MYKGTSNVIIFSRSPEGKVAKKYGVMEIVNSSGKIEGNRVMMIMDATVEKYY